MVGTTHEEGGVIMMIAVLLAGWLVGSVPLAVLLGRMISGADTIGARLYARRRPAQKFLKRREVTRTEF
jgi:uncharacterized protein (DUF2062 family)